MATSKQQLEQMPAFAHVNHVPCADVSVVTHLTFTTYYYSSLYNKEMDAQRGPVTCLRSHSWVLVDPGSKLSGPRVHAFMKTSG